MINIHVLWAMLSLLVLPTGGGESDLLEGKNRGTQTSFYQHARELHSQLEGEPPSFPVFQTALTGYHLLKQQEKIGDRSLLTIIDYSLASYEKRMWVIRLQPADILYHNLVAHGKKSGAQLAKHFSNKVGSRQSSLGFYVTGKIYTGKHGRSLRLYGLENQFNGNAYKRNIVMHGAKYVSQQFIDRYGRLGRSFGCPAVPKGQNKQIIQTIADRTCLFIYYPDSAYLHQSKWLDSSQVKIN